MDHGRIIAQGTPDGLIQEHCQGMTIRLSPEQYDSMHDKDPAHAHRVTRTTKEYIEIEALNPNATLARFLAQGLDLSQMAFRAPNLEDVFLNLTGRQLRE